MAKQTPVWKLLLICIQRTLGALKVLLPLSLVIGGIGGVLLWQVGELALPYAGPNPQSKLLYSGLAKVPVDLLWGCLMFPIIDAATIYAWRCAQAGKSLSLYSAVNWSLARYKRMVGPHAKAYVSITLGMMVIVPGILFGLQYAFVDAIAATDERSKRPLARSQKLTRGRRTRIFRSWIPYAIWLTFTDLKLVFLAESMGFWAVMALGTFDLLVLAVMEMLMYAMYEERIEAARAAQAARAAKESGGAESSESPVEG